jgi:protein tyrosine/serine phosphatase
MNRRHLITAMAATLLPFGTAQARPKSWAAKLNGGKALPNLHRITPSFYRSGQPAGEGFAIAAKTYGIKTIVSLNDKPDVATAPGLTLVHVKMNAFKTADDDDPQLPLALAAIQKGIAQGNTLVHCQHGKDRTGGIVAVWRVLYQGWTKESAIAEMERGGYGYNSFLFSNGRHIRSLDIEKLRGQVEAL